MSADCFTFFLNVQFVNPRVSPASTPPVVEPPKPSAKRNRRPSRKNSRDGAEEEGRAKKQRKTKEPGEGENFYQIAPLMRRDEWISVNNELLLEDNAQLHIVWNIAAHFENGLRVSFWPLKWRQNAVRRAPRRIKSSRRY